MKPEHGGLDDKTVEMFGEFMKLVKTENETARQAMDDMDLDEDFKCAICLDLLYRPQMLEPCRHIFCETCLKRARICICPMCRTPIDACQFSEGT